MTNLSGIIVAGGRSRRMGWDKRRARLWGPAGPTLLEHTVALLTPLCHEVIVVLNDPQAWPGLAARCVEDYYPGTGVLGGLYTGLRSATCPTALVVAADMPMLNPALLQAMITTCFEGDILIPVARSDTNRSGYEPLHAIYRTQCLPHIQAALTAGSYAIHDLLAQLHLSIFPAAQMDSYDPHGYALRNLNTPDDLAMAEPLITNPSSSALPICKSNPDQDE
ncbi:molybdenum cofactor guanylyltransferase [Candidatus Oscillochloris fontis]|uniref:molybdenum cofactor guanylyltransferase n=1 Tax=Candidatus Oscillochloris fontis TaxID=2496868 RepID=UPI00101C70B6|nr:molybdenum cofactor guanylyltransferase [Candidatus Oscillochloris fontis]